jgi:hypothetical protein
MGSPSLKASRVSTLIIAQGVIINSDVTNLKDAEEQEG